MLFKNVSTGMQLASDSASGQQQAYMYGALAVALVAVALFIMLYNYADITVPVVAGAIVAGAGAAYFGHKAYCKYVDVRKHALDVGMEVGMDFASNAIAPERSQFIVPAAPALLAPASQTMLDTSVSSYPTMSTPSYNVTAPDTPASSPYPTMSTPSYNLTAPETEAEPSVSGGDFAAMAALGQQAALKAKQGASDIIKSQIAPKLHEAAGHVQAAAHNVMSVNNTILPAIASARAGDMTSLNSDSVTQAMNALQSTTGELNGVLTTMQGVVAPFGITL